MVNLSLALKSLTDNKVEFVIIGGVAITAYGSAYITKPEALREILSDEEE